MPEAPPKSELVSRITAIMRRDLKLGPDIPIHETTPFFGGDADIDSLDILLLLGSIEREFKIKIPSEQVGRRVFENVGTLSDYLQTQLASGNGNGQAAPSAPVADPLAKLPHRDPFRFVTKLTTLEAGQSAEGIWSITGSEDFFRGHFPGNPIVPGVLIVEALAQLCGLARSNGGPGGKLAQIDVRFEEAVIPPADIQLKARALRAIGSLIQYEVRAIVGNASVARGTLTLHLPPGAAI